MSRAGFGGSSVQQSGNGNVLDANARDYKALISYLGLGRCYLLAHATGFASAFHFASRYPELTRKVLGLDPVPPINRFADMGKLVGLFKASALTMTKAPATFSLMTRLAMRRLNTFDDEKKSYRRHILYPSVELDTLESAAGIAAGTRNIQDLMVNNLRQMIPEARVFRGNWSALGPDSNRRPEVVLFHTKNNPFVSASGTTGFASELDCEIVNLAETFPFLEPHLRTMLNRIF